MYPIAQQMVDHPDNFINDLYYLTRMGYREEPYKIIKWRKIQFMKKPKCGFLQRVRPKILFTFEEDIKIGDLKKDFNFFRVYTERVVITDQHSSWEDGQVYQQYWFFKYRGAEAGFKLKWC